MSSGSAVLGSLAVRRIPSCLSRSRDPAGLASRALSEPSQATGPRASAATARTLTACPTSTAARVALTMTGPPCGPPPLPKEDAAANAPALGARSCERPEQAIEQGSSRRRAPGHQERSSAVHESTIHRWLLMRFEHAARTLSLQRCGMPAAVTDLWVLTQDGTQLGTFGKRDAVQKSGVVSTEVAA